MADINANRWAKILHGGIGVLLAVVGYFLVSRDSDVKETTARFWAQIAALRQEVTDLKIRLEQRAELLQWIVDGVKDKEQRIRDLEKECGKNRK